MSRWLTTALVLALAPGCLAHERPGFSADAGRLAVDGGNLLPRDAGTDAFVVPPIDAGPPPACTHEEVSVGVRIEAITSDVARCQFTHAEHAALTGIAAEAAAQGIRFHFDLCPSADADCRCDVIVSNVGADIADTLGPDFDVTVDVGPGDGFFPGAFVAITKVPTCECLGCPCSEPLYFYAATQQPESARAVPAPMTFSTGAMVCPASDCTFGGTSRLHARGDGGEADVPAHTQVELGSVHVRALRDVEVFAPCAACAGCSTPIGAWAAWVTSQFTP